MIIGTFIFYFILFIVIFSYPNSKDKKKSKSVIKSLTIPAILGAGVVLLTVIKVYFVYKIFALLFGMVLILLTYWQWGGKIRHWWK